MSDLTDMRAEVEAATFSVGIAMEGLARACEQLADALTGFREWIEDCGLYDIDPDLGGDATSTGIGDPLAGVLRSIEELTEASR